MLLLGILISMLYFSPSLSQNNNFIRDYFLYKNVTSVVGFSCNEINDDSDLVKVLTKAGVKISIKGPGSKYNILNFLTSESNRLGVFLDLRCNGHDAIEIFRQSSNERLYDYAYNWLILAPNLTYTIEILNDTSFNFETDFVVSSPANKHIMLFDFYNPCKYRGGVINITMLGSWSEKNELNITLKDPFPIRRRNFHGLTLNMGGLIAYRPPDISLLDYLEDKYMKNKLDVRSIFGYLLLSHILDIFNLTANIVEYPIWDKNDKDGPEIGNLSLTKIDFGYTPLIPTIERFTITQVVLAVWPLRTCFFIRALPSTKLKMGKILRPLAPESWILTVICTAIAISIFSVVTKVEYSGESSDSNYEDAALATFGSLCQQGVASCWSKVASRIAYLHILIFGLLLYNYYGAAIVSARLHEPIDKLNDSLYTLVKSNLKMASAKLLFFEYLLQDPNWEVQYFKRHWNSIPESQRFIEMIDGVRRVKEGDFAFHSDPDEAYPFFENYFDDISTCQLTEIHLLRPVMGALFTTKNKQFHEIAKIGLLRIWSAGLLKRELIRWKSRKPYCDFSSRTVEPITIYEVAPILVLWFIGFVASIFILIGEIIISYFPRLENHIKIFKRILIMSN